MHLTDYLVTFSRSTRLIHLCVSRQLEKDSLQSIQHLLQVITLSVEGPMKSKAARRFPSTTCQRHFSLKKHSGDEVIPRCTEKFQENPFSRYSFFSPSVIRGTGKYVARSFLLLYRFELIAQSFWLGVRLWSESARNVLCTCMEIVNT